jgi:hypothetical protein
MLASESATRKPVRRISIRRAAEAGAVMPSIARSDTDCIQGAYEGSVGVMLATALLLTRDVRRYRAYFPGLTLIAPEG